MLPFTVDELNTAVVDGQVTVRPHPTLPLNIYNYSPEVAYSNRWTNVTRVCRGLILDHDYNIVARPWEKFFNLGQVELPIQFDTTVEVMDKLDGSLGILYPSSTGFSVATRGSFDSEQSRHATKVWQDLYNDNYIEALDSHGFDYTYLFEIIYPANRIVLDYNGWDDLVLLGAVEKETGYYISPLHAQALIGWTGPVVDVMPFNTLTDAMKHMERKNAEGFVIRSHNFMVKLKQPDYIELHKLVTNASPKTVWEQLRQGKTKSEIVSAFPDEFHSYIESMIDPLLESYDARFMEIIEGYEVRASRVGTFKTRADYAREFKKDPDAKYFFLLLDDRSIKDVLWTELKPSGTDKETDRDEQ